MRQSQAMLKLGYTPEKLDYAEIYMGGAFYGALI